MFLLLSLLAIFSSLLQQMSHLPKLSTVLEQLPHLPSLSTIFEQMQLPANSPLAMTPFLSVDAPEPMWISWLLVALAVLTMLDDGIVWLLRFKAKDAKRDTEAPSPEAPGPSPEAATPRPGSSFRVPDSDDDDDDDDEEHFYDCMAAPELLPSPPPARPETPPPAGPPVDGGSGAPEPSEDVRSPSPSPFDQRDFEERLFKSLYPNKKFTSRAAQMQRPFSSSLDRVVLNQGTQTDEFLSTNQGSQTDDLLSTSQGTQTGGLLSKNQGTQTEFVATSSSTQTEFVSTSHSTQTEDPGVVCEGTQTVPRTTDQAIQTDSGPVCPNTTGMTDQGTLTVDQHEVPTTDSAAAPQDAQQPQPEEPVQQVEDDKKPDEEVKEQDVVPARRLPVLAPRSLRAHRPDAPEPSDLAASMTSSFVAPPSLPSAPTGPFSLRVDPPSVAAMRSSSAAPSLESLRRAPSEARFTDLLPGSRFASASSAPAARPFASSSSGSGSGSGSFAFSLPGELPSWAEAPALFAPVAPAAPAAPVAPAPAAPAAGEASSETAAPAADEVEVEDSSAAAAATPSRADEAPAASPASSTRRVRASRHQARSRIGKPGGKHNEGLVEPSPSPQPPRRGGGGLADSRWA